MPYPTRVPQPPVVSIPGASAGRSGAGYDASAAFRNSRKTPQQLADEERRRQLAEEREAAVHRAGTQNRVDSTLRQPAPTPSPSMEGITRAASPAPRPGGGGFLGGAMPWAPPSDGGLGAGGVGPNNGAPERMPNQPGPPDLPPDSPYNPENPVAESERRRQEIELEARLRKEEADAERAARQGESAAERAARQAEAQANRDFEKGMLSEKARLNDETFNKRFAMLSQAGGDSTGPGGGGPPATYDPTKVQSARDAAFARAKDIHGQTARASLDAIRNVLGERGFLGGGMEAGATANVVNNAAGGIGEFNRDQLTSDLDFATGVDNREYEARERAKDRNATYRNSLLGLVNATLY